MSHPARAFHAPVLVRSRLVIAPAAGRILTPDEEEAKWQAATAHLKSLGAPLRKMPPAKLAFRKDDAQS